MYDYFKATYRRKSVNGDKGMSVHYLLKHLAGNPLKLRYNPEDTKIIITRLSEAQYENALEKITRSNGQVERRSSWMD